MSIQGVYVDVASFKGMSEIETIQVADKNVRKPKVIVGRKTGKFYNLTVLPNQPGFLVLSLGKQPQSFKELTQKLHFIFQEKIPLILAEKHENGEYFKGTFCRDLDPKPVDDAASAFNRINKLSIYCRQGWCRWCIALQTLFNELPIPLDWIAHRNGQEWEGIKVRYFKRSDLPNLVQAVAGKEVVQNEVNHELVEMNHNIPLFRHTRAAKAKDATWFPLFAQVCHKAMGSVYKTSLEQKSSWELRLECLEMMVLKVIAAVVQPFYGLIQYCPYNNPFTYRDPCNKVDDMVTTIVLSPVVHLLGAIKCLAGAIIHPSIMIKSIN